MIENIIAVDPGFKGGVTIIEKDEVSVYRMPVRKITVNKRNKHEYNLKELMQIIQGYDSDKTIFVIEQVSPRPGEGTVSAFSFGRGFGQLEGVAIACDMQVVKIRPQSWKKTFPKLKEMECYADPKKLQDDLKAQIKEKKEEKKEHKSKSEEYKEIAAEIKSLKKELKKAKREVRKGSKDASRFLAMEFYPDLKEEFKLKRDDGKSDSLLLGLHVKENLEEYLEESDEE